MLLGRQCSKKTSNVSPSSGCPRSLLSTGQGAAAGRQGGPARARRAGTVGGGVAAHRGPRAVTGPSEIGRSPKPWAEGEGTSRAGSYSEGRRACRSPGGPRRGGGAGARASVAPLAVTAPRARAPGPFGGEADSSRAGLGVVFVTAKVFTPRNWNCRLFTLWGSRFGKEVKNRV